MADDRSVQSRSHAMRQVHSRDTSCEMMLRRQLHRRGLRYSLKKKLPGSPDIVFVAARVAVFVDGCFWHGCIQHCRRPSSNVKYWQAKIDRNMARDKKVTIELADLGWRVIRIWEHEIKTSPDRAAARVERIVRRRCR